MYCLKNWYSDSATLNTKPIRLSIFLIAGVCAGFPALIWALSVLYRHYKSGGRTSVFTIFLLLSDLLELILTPFLVTYIFKEDFNPCGIIFGLLFGARLLGQLLHQTVALESICQRYLLPAEVFSPPCSIVFSIVFLLAVACHFIQKTIYVITVFVGILPLIVCAYILTCKVPHDSDQATDRKPSVLVVTVAMFTLMLIYLPFFLTVFTDIPFILDCLTSMRLISDPLLCVLVCKELGFNSHTDRTEGSRANYQL